MEDQASSNTTSRPSRVEVDTNANSVFASPDLRTAGEREKGKGETRNRMTNTTIEARRRTRDQQPWSILFPPLPMTLALFFLRLISAVCESCSATKRESELQLHCASLERSAADAQFQPLPRPAQTLPNG